MGSGASTVPGGTTSALQEAVDAGAVAGANNVVNSVDNYPELVDAICEEIGYVRRRIAGDGNCLFRCLAERVLGDEELHIRVRNEVVAKMSEDPKKVEQFLEQPFDTYAERMRMDGVWGGEVELRTAAELYSCGIMVYSLTHPPIYIGAEPRRDDTIPVLYFKQCHYDLLYTVEEMNLMEEALGDLRGVSPTGAARWRKKMEQTEEDDFELAMRLQRGEIPSPVPTPKSDIDDFLRRQPSVKRLVEQGSVRYSDLSKLIEAVESEKRRQFDLPSDTVANTSIRPANSIRSRCDSIDTLLKKRPTIQEMVINGILQREDVKNSLIASEKMNA